MPCLMAMPHLWPCVSRHWLPPKEWRMQWPFLWERDWWHATWEHLSLPLSVCASSQRFKVFPQNFHFVWYWIFNLGPVCSLALRFQTLWRSFLLEVNEQIQPVQTSSFRLNGKAGTLSLLFFWGSYVTLNDFSLWLLTTQGHPWFFKCWAALLWLHMSTNCIFSLFVCVSVSYKTGKVQPLRSFSQALSGHEDSTTVVLTHPFCCFFY